MKQSARKFIIFSILLFSISPIFSQILSKREFKKAVQEADIYYLYDQNYEKAASLYESLIINYPENANLFAKLGICYLNIDGKKADALKYLLKASVNIAKDEKEYLQYGEKAPLDTYLYLAVAYHQNDSLQKAIALYTDAKKRLSGTNLFSEEYIDSQIGDCYYALDMKKKPLTMITDLFAGWLADYPGASNPVLSKNDSVFIFTQKTNGKTRILCSYKSGTWKRPVNITDQLGGYDRFYSNSITGDGKLLIIYMDDGGDGNLYYSQRKDTVWTKIKSVGKPINSIYWESHGFITPDGKTMYFSSNRPGGQGELDIWHSEKNANGKWGEPVNCGDIINTPYNEDTPFFDPESGALIFSSNGHISMGGYDIFRSVKRGVTWTNPIGMPFAFNNTSNNTFFILNNNKPGFITSLFDENTKSRNIYEIVAENPENKITLARGVVTLQDGMAIDPKQIRISLVDTKRVTPPKDIILSDSASFNFELKPGDYQVFISQAGYKTDTINLNIPLYYSGKYVSVNAALIPDKVFSGQFLAINNILFDFDSYKLNDQAKSELEVVKSILVSYPDLTVEVAGYTDAIGSKEYNRILADKRAEAVIEYLVTYGITSPLFIKKAYGKSDFVAVNSNPDGTDNPEGRKFNRRVTFGVVDPKTGVTLHKETYTPEHLRQKYSLRYSIILLKTGEKLLPNRFSALTKNDLLFIRTLKMDSATMYVLGVFNNKTEAMKYLGYAKGLGFNEAYVLNQYELDNELKVGSAPEMKKVVLDKIDKNVYTIQLKATMNPLDIGRVFSGVEGINETKSSDGFYRYYYGEYKSLPEAKEALLNIKKAGYDDAFIRNLYELMSQ